MVSADIYVLQFEHTALVRQICLIDMYMYDAQQIIHAALLPGYYFIMDSLLSVHQLCVQNGFDSLLSAQGFGATRFV